MALKTTKKAFKNISTLHIHICTLKPFQLTQNTSKVDNCAKHESFNCDKIASSTDQMIKSFQAPVKTFLKDSVFYSVVLKTDIVKELSLLSDFE